MKPRPPEVQLFELPTLTGEKADYNGYINPLEPAPRLDADAIFHQAVNCYPEPTKFNVELNLEGGVRSQGVVTADNSSIGSTIGKEYVGIVARMPLYSSKEMNREREREYMRRTKTSEFIGAFLTTNQITPYRALESRSQVRV